MARVPYPCRVWTRVGLNCPPGFMALVEDEDDDDDDDDDDDEPHLPWQAVGRRLRDRLPSTPDNALQMAELALVFDEVRRILDKRTVLQRAAWSQFDIPHVVPRLVRQTTGGRRWQEEVAIAAVIVLAGFAVYRSMSAVGGRRLAVGSVVLGAAGIVAPFLAGQESEPRVLNMVPAYAYAQYQDRRKRRMEEEVTGHESGELIFESPPGGGAPGLPVHYLWYNPKTRTYVVKTTRQSLNDIQQLMIRSNMGNWLMRFSTRAELDARLAQIHNAGFERWYAELVRQLTEREGGDPLEDQTNKPGSEDEGGNEEIVDESVPIGNRW